MKYPIGDLFTPPSCCIYNLTTSAISTGTPNINGTTATTMLPSNQPLQKFVTHVLEFTNLTSEFHSVMNWFSYYPTTITAHSNSIAVSNSSSKIRSPSQHIINGRQDGRKLTKCNLIQSNIDTLIPFLYPMMHPSNCSYM